MYEGLNHWTFVSLSYLITVVGTSALVWSSWRAMRRAEARRDQARER